jgi:ElaB/YqjD/DUF883 family membrane-anchored ribosome-binding protein
VRWPWRRARPSSGNGHAAQERAGQALDAAQQMRPQVDETVRAANEAVRRADRFTREVERSLHLRRGST